MKFEKKHKSFVSRLVDGFKGIFLFMREELGFAKYSALIIFLILIIYFINPTHLELIMILIAVALGFFIGFVNMIIEKLCDLVSLEYNPLIRDIKDLAAGACMLYMLIFVAILAIVYLT